MSLQVWLPLTKDLRQQGLSSAIIVNNGASTSTAGKLGGCYSFNGSSNYLYTTGQGYFGNNYSFAAWVYTTSTSATQTIGCIRTAVGSGFSLFLIGGKLRIDPGGNNVQWTTSYTYPANTWFHLVVTYDGTTVKYYINGEYKQSYTATISSTYWGNTLSFGASQANGSSYGNYLNGRLNDIRVYNHALSQMEVKQLSQGLMLHYPLNRNGWGQENILLNSALEKTGASNVAQWFRWNTNTTLTANQTYTLSFDAKMTIATDVFYISWSNNDSTQEVWNQGTTVTTEYKRYSFTGVTTKTNINAILMSNYKGYNRGNNNNTTGVLSVKNVKLELGSIATPWCPNSSDTLATTLGLNGTIEYDCSGFCNNGERVGSLVYSSNTAKYAVSTYISNGANERIITPTLNFSIDAITLNIWFKSTNTSGSNGYHMIVDSTANRQWYEIAVNNSGYFRGGLYVNGTRYADNCTSTNALNGEWHMLTLIYDGTAVKRYYDGILEKSSNVTITSGLSSPTALVLGRDGPNATYACKESYLSDFRIYATALSADDVKSLYQNCATIDPDGTIRGQIRS